MEAHPDAIRDHSHPQPQRSRSRRPWTRRKVVLACEPCRRRKVRCDGAMPMCGPCKVRPRSDDRWKCVYQENSGARGVVTKEYIKSLHDRIRTLEDREVQKFQDQNRSRPAAGRSDSPAASAPPAATISPMSNIEAASQYLDTGGMNADQPGSVSEDEDHPINAMGTVITITERMLDSRDHFYGSSSSVSFSQQIQQTQKRLLHPASAATMSSPNSPLGRSLSGRSRPRRIPAAASSRSNHDPLSDLLTSMSPTPKLDDWCLPPRALADHLMRCYWDRVHCLYPFVHQTSFTTAYNRIWSASPPNDPAEDGHLSPSASATAATETRARARVGLGGPECPTSVFYSALNAIFALSVQFSDVRSPSERATLSETFFRRAKQVLRIDIVDEGNLALIQTLLIMAQYLQSTRYPNRCWNVVGLAVRMAQGLGLCVDSDANGDEEASTEKEPFLEVQMRRRTWYGCVTLDLVLSMTLGRPSSLSGAWPIQIPAAVDDEYMDATSVTGIRQPNNVFPRISFFIHTIHLYDILRKILAAVYNLWSPVPAVHKIDSSSKQHQKRSEMGCDPSTLVRLDQELTDFESSVQPELYWVSTQRMYDGDPSTAVFERQRNVLHARFLHLKILLYRPIFTQHCRDTFAPSTDNSGAARQFAAPGRGDQTREKALHSVFSQRCSVACVQAAQELIELVSMSSKTSATGAWWYNVFYLFTAAMVILLAELCGPAGLASPDSLDASWQRCQTALQFMSRYHSAAQSCSDTLNAMRRRAAPAANSDAQQQPQRYHMTAGPSTPSPAVHPSNQDESYVYGFPISHVRSANTNPSGLIAPSAEDSRQPAAPFSFSRPGSAATGNHSGSGSLNRLRSDRSGQAVVSEIDGGTGAGAGSGNSNLQSDQQLIDLLWSEVGSLPTWSFEDGRAWWWEDESGEYGTVDDSHYAGRL